jgi:hypothetical protein
MNENSNNSITIGTSGSGVLSARGSIVIGDSASVENGESQIVIGDSAYISVPNSDSANNIAIGKEAVIDSLRSTTTLSNAIAIGAGACVQKSDAIQLGNGTIEANYPTILQVNEFPLLNRLGKIYLDRIPSDAIGGEDNPVYGLFFRDINDNNKLWYVGIENGQLSISEY